MPPEMWLDLERFGPSLARDPMFYPKFVAPPFLGAFVPRLGGLRQNFLHAVLQVHHVGQGSSLLGPDESDPPAW